MKKMCLILLAALLISGMIFANGQQSSETEGAKKLVVWETLWSNAAQSMTSLSEAPLYKELEKRTGVEVSFIHPAEGQEDEQFNLLVASNDLPDMIFRTWTDYPGGPVKAISDEVILELNDILKSSSPNLSARLAEHPEWDKAVKTDAGQYYCFPFIRGDSSLQVFWGPALRKDILDNLGLEVPETMAEWESVLTTLKDSGIEAPITFTKPQSYGRELSVGSPFIGAYGIQWGFYLDNGKVKFGLAEDSYKDFLETWNRWYENGLIDPEFVTNDRKTFEAKVLNGISAAFTGYGGSNIGNFLDAMETKNPTFDLVGAKYPVLNKGDKPFTGQFDVPFKGMGYAITTQAADPELAASWADYAYGDDGHMLFNFGVEGESFNWVEDYRGYEEFPKYSDMINNNPNGLGIAQASARYVRAFYNGAFLQDKRYIVQYYRREQQVDAWEKWSYTDAPKHQLPAITMTPEESEEYAAIFAEIETYYLEMYVKFTAGAESLDNFDDYLAQLDKMGLNRAIEIQQAAYDRYNAR